MRRLRLRGRFDPGEGRVLVALAFGIAAVEGTRPTASYRALELGAGAFEVGIVAGAFAALAFLVAVPIGRAVDRLGERRFLVVGAALLIMATVIGLLLPYLVALVVMQATLGLGQVCMAISAQTLAGNTGSSGDLRFARLSVATAFGHMFGPLLGGTVIEGGLGGLFGGGTTGALAMMACFGVAALAIASFSQPSGVRRQATSTSPKIGILPLLRLRGMPQAMYVSIASLTTMDLLVAYLPVIGEERGIRPSVVGYLLATRAAMTILSRVSMGILLKSLGRRPLLLSAMAVAGGAVICIALPVPVALLFGVMGVAGFTLGVGMPMTTAWVSARAPEGARGIAMAVRMTGNRTSQVLVPIALGGVAAGFGAGAIFVVSGAGLGIAAWLVRSAPLESGGAAAPPG